MANVPEAQFVYHDTDEQLDRALQYGDGLFETITVRGGKLPLLAQHLARLSLGAGRLGIHCPDSAALAAAVSKTARQAGEPDGIVKLILSRGIGGRGYRVGSGCASRIYLSWHAPAQVQPVYDGCVLVRICKTPMGLNPALAGMKHLNRLEQVLGSTELEPQEYDGLMMDTAGRIIEGTKTNLFVCHGERLSTPKLDEAGVHGVMREVLLQLFAEHGRNVLETRMTLEDLESASELFLCNSAVGVVPIARVTQGCHWASGQLGPVAALAMDWLRARGLQSL